MGFKILVKTSTPVLENKNAICRNDSKPFVAKLCPHFVPSNRLPKEVVLTRDYYRSECKLIFYITHGGS